MKEQVSMIRSAWEVETSWSRWERSRSGAEGSLGVSSASWFDAFEDALVCEWLSGVVMFGLGKGLKVIGRGVLCQSDLEAKIAKTCGISSLAVAPINISVTSGCSGEDDMVVR